MYRYFIKSLIILLACSSIVFAQDETQETATDTIIYKQKYGLRLGADISKLARSFFDNDYQGFEVNADYRLTQGYTFQES